MPRCLGSPVRVRPGSFSRVPLVRRGPLFFCDYLVSSPIKCKLSLIDGVKSTALHFLVLATPGLLLALCAVLIGCEQLDYFDEIGDSVCTIDPYQAWLLGLAVTIDVLGFCYATAWYLDLAWAVQKPLRYLAMYPWLLGAFFGVFFLVETVRECNGCNGCNVEDGAPRMARWEFLCGGWWAVRDEW